MSGAALDERWPAPGKLNLMLKVVGRKPDGYHLLQTVFQFIDRCDWLTFEVQSDGRIELHTPLAGVPVAEDLTVRAAHLLQEVSGCQHGVRIRVEKNLPMGGGLGGGSSDAATTLMALNRLWGVDLPMQPLLELGLQLGADVPVFIKGHSAWGEGVGERLTPVQLPTPWYVVLVPACHVSTQAVFSSRDLTRDSKPVTIADFNSGCKDNDCLSVVEQLYPVVGEAMRALAMFGASRLTGTGACVFAAFATRSRAREVADKLSARWTVLLTKGVNRSALHQRLVQYDSMM